MKKMLMLNFVMLISVVGLIGCNAEINNAGYQKESNAGQDFVTNNPKNMTKDLDNYTELPSDQIMNTPNTVSNTSPTTGEEIKQAKETVKNKTGYEATGVYINSKTMVVTIDDHGKIKSEAEWKKEEEKIQNLLTKALPRYDIDVKRDQ